MGNLLSGASKPKAKHPSCNHFPAWHQENQFFPQGLYLLIGKMRAWDKWVHFKRCPSVSQFMSWRCLCRGQCLKLTFLSAFNRSEAIPRTVQVLTYSTHPSPMTQWLPLPTPIYNLTWRLRHREDKSLTTQVCLPQRGQRQNLNPAVWFQSPHKEWTWVPPPHPLKSKNLRRDQARRTSTPHFCFTPSTAASSFFLRFHVYVFTMNHLLNYLFLNPLAMSFLSFFPLLRYFIWIFQNDKSKLKLNWNYE